MKCLRKMRTRLLATSSRTSLYRHPSVLLVVLVGLGFGLAGCSSQTSSSQPPPRVAVQSPVDTALSWFKSVNDHDLPLALAHFAPGSREQMEWSDFGSTTFTNVQCSLVSATSTTSDVRCTYGLPNLPGRTFWTVDMERTPPGPWLITSYGQP